AEAETAAETETETAAAAAAALSRHRIDTIAELLRIVSPLFVPASAPGAGLAGSRAAAGRTALHIPVVALLIHLEAVDFAAAAHRYESATDVCSSLLTSLDVHTQLSCLTQMMHLLIDPHRQLSVAATQQQQQQQPRRRRRRRTPS
ncbi:uncharacterized protein Tco025E_07091, partial [Trypanosoma conorhini]